MTDTPEVQGQLVAGNTDSILQRFFTGHISGPAGMGATPLIGTISSVQSDFDAKVTINSFASSAEFTCYYEPHFDASHNPIRPNVGTTCIVVFPSNDPQGIGWIVMFRGWP